MDDNNYQINVLQDQCRKAFTFLCFYERDLAACEATYKEFFGEYLLANATLEAEYKEKIVALNNAKKIVDEEAIQAALLAKESLYALASCVNAAHSAGSGEFEASLRSDLAQIVDTTDFSQLNNARLEQAKDAFVRGDSNLLKNCIHQSVTPNPSIDPLATLEHVVKSLREESQRVAKTLNDEHYREKLATPDARYTEEGRLFAIHETLKNNIECIDAELETIC